MMKVFVFSLSFLAKDTNGESFVFSWSFLTKVSKGESFVFSWSFLAKDTMVKVLVGLGHFGQEYQR